MSVTLEICKIFRYFWYQMKAEGLVITVEHFWTFNFEY